MKQLILATHNRHKAEEFQMILAGLDMEILTLDRYPDISDIVEDADTLEGNALKKAHTVHRHTGLPSVADDTGLEVFYLNNAPGVFSSRYAGEGASYADNCKKLLSDLRGLPPRRRAARFRCVLAFVAPGGVERLAEGVCRGTILENGRGEGGFGYDPVFRPAGWDLTFAEMEPAVKNSLSHRALALQALRGTLQEYFKTSETSPKR